MKIFRKRYHPAGTSPGTLGAMTSDLPLTIKLIDYTAEDFIEKQISTPSDCRPYLERDTTTWIHAQGGVKSDTLLAIGQIFDLHHLALEDIINKGQRAKLEEYDDQIFIVMQLPDVVISERN